MVSIDYDDGEGLFGVGMTEPKKERARAKRKKDLNFHRLVPRDQWDVTFVVKEFRHMMYLKRPDILGIGVDSKSMATALNIWRRDHDLQIADIITAMDLFFEGDTPSMLRETPKPYTVFLRFLQDQYRSILAAASLDDKWLNSLEDQMEDFRG